ETGNAPKSETPSRFFRFERYDAAGNDAATGLPAKRRTVGQESSFCESFLSLRRSARTLKSFRSSYWETPRARHRARFSNPCPNCVAGDIVDILCRHPATRTLKPYARLKVNTGPFGQ